MAIAAGLNALLNVPAASKQAAHRVELAAHAKTARDWMEVLVSATGASSARPQSG
jgi:hypothetical protein